MSKITGQYLNTRPQTTFLLKLGPLTIKKERVRKSEDRQAPVSILVGQCGGHLPVRERVYRSLFPCCLCILHCKVTEEGKKTQPCINCSGSRKQASSPVLKSDVFFEVWYVMAQVIHLMDISQKSPGLLSPRTGPRSLGI